MPSLMVPYQPAPNGSPGTVPSRSPVASRIWFASSPPNPGGTASSPAIRAAPPSAMTRRTATRSGEGGRCKSRDSGNAAATAAAPSVSDPAQAAIAPTGDRSDPCRTQVAAKRASDASPSAMTTSARTPERGSRGRVGSGASAGSGPARRAARIARTKHAANAPKTGAAGTGRPSFSPARRSHSHAAVAPPTPTASGIQASRRVITPSGAKDLLLGAVEPPVHELDALHQGMILVADLVLP